MVSPGEHVLVALSGGADSVATLAALVRLAPRLGVRLSAAHVHHGLRGREADEDAAFAERLAAELDVPFRLIRLSRALARGGNVEERARELRYRALREIAAEIGAGKIATGHTRDDQAETVLLRLVRGCGPRGLAGIRPVVRADGEATIIRPLLQCDRAQIESFLADLGLAHREDSSNRSPRFQRNRIRYEVLPLLRELNPAVDRALADLAAVSRDQEEWRQGLGSDGDLLAVSLLAAQAPGRRGEAVRQWLESRRGDLRGLTRRHMIAVVGLAGAGRPNRRVELPRGLVVREYDHLRYVAAGTTTEESLRDGGRLRPGQAVELGDWRLEAGAIEQREASMRLPADLWTAVVDADRAPPVFVIRTPIRGDRVRPHGMTGQRKLSDIFIDRRVPRGLRSCCPVVEAEAQVLWVPGVVRGSLGLVGAQTRRVIRLRAESGSRPLLG